MYELIRRLFCLAVALFYRGRTLGEHIPKEGPLIIVANHPNGLIDPIMVMALTDRPVRFLAKEPLFRMPVIGLLLRAVHALPIFRSVDGADTDDNLRTFSAVTAALKAGQVICLFPEGVSHDEPEIQPLKTGAARMALQAEAECGFELGVRIVPVGLHLPQKTLFRSEAATWVGAAVGIDGEIARNYESDSRGAARELTDEIAEAMRSVTVELNGWEDLELLELAGQIWTDDQDPVVRLQAMADAERTFIERHAGGTRRLRRRLLAFARDLRTLGIDVSDLDLEWRWLPAVGFTIRNLMALVIGAPIALCGAIIYVLPYQLVRLVTTVAKPSPDVVATVKILSSMLLFSVWHGACVYALCVYLGWAWSLALGGSLPLAGVYFHHFWERRSEALRQASYLLQLPFRRRLRQRLLREREAIRAEIDAFAKIL